MWALFASLFYASKFNAQRPQVKKDYDEQKRVNKGGKPREPSPEEWSAQEELARFHDEIVSTGTKAAFSPYDFEETFLFRDHLFEKPPPEKVKTAEEIKAEELERNRQFVEESKAYFLKDSILARAARAREKETS